MATASSATPSQLSAADAPSPTTAARRGAMAVLAQARAEEIEQGLRAVMDPVDYVELRAPETGLVMLRGRIGGGRPALHLRAKTGERVAVPIAAGEGGLAPVPPPGHKKTTASAGLCAPLHQPRG